MDVAVVGGGAAGFFGAIACGETCPDAEVILLEAGRESLAKVRISGGGRCNVTHACFDPAQLILSYPRGGKALRGAFSRFQPKDTIAWFERRGVRLKTETDGRMFPITDDSATIVDCLQRTAIAAGVSIKTSAAVKSVSKIGDRFELALRSGEMRECDRLLLATGSNPAGYGWAKGLGHEIITPVPSLFTFQVADPRLQGLAGVAVPQVQVQLMTGDKQKTIQTGDLLITHWGLSGPAILKLSAWGARLLCDRRYRMQLRINWLPSYSQDALREKLEIQKGRSPRKHIVNDIDLPLPKRLWQRLVGAAGIEAETNWADLSKKQINLLILELSQGEYAIQGKGVFKEEFVTCGGVDLKGVNFKTMESKTCSGLFFAGEILDIDGVTGGFNFQSAWTTGWLAGLGMASIPLKNGD